MPSLQARSSLRRTHPLLLLNKLVSLTAFMFLFGAGWVVLSYLKTELVSRSNNATEAYPTPTQGGAASASVRVNQNSSAEVKALSEPVRLVYSCNGDNEHYHTSAHLPARRERSALSEEAALQRGLKPCHVCMPE